MVKQSPERAVITAAPDLETKSTPSRRKGKTTFEAILVTAGELLAEVGFERLTTNLVCERAGLTPPALYRYFPNKYALLAELARRLMDAQDEVFLAWLDRGDAAARTLEEAVTKGIELRTELLRVTRSQPGGMSILRAIRAVPVLQQVRIESREKVVAHQMKILAELFPRVSAAQLEAAVRLSEEVGYGVIEMLLEDPSLDVDRVIAESAWMSALYYQHLVPR
ncbi:TetR/AcrR family transcriptional regulator [Caulobacter sp. 1776]|uniref:TetR/AcrR family transcriptional regulator n=1 Tax=Caulobacter sp. 1776 TaxID=3156420 RepID=UPI0033946604